MSEFLLAEPPIGRESYMHRAAKEVVVRWLRESAARLPMESWACLLPVMWRSNRAAPCYGVWAEYPMTSSGMGTCHVWDECDRPEWCDRPPTVEEMAASGMRPFCVADIAIQHKGAISTVIEIVHRNPLSDRKREFYAIKGIEVFCVSAAWVLRQTACPSELETLP